MKIDENQAKTASSIGSLVLQTSRCHVVFVCSIYGLPARWVTWSPGGSHGISEGVATPGTLQYPPAPVERLQKEAGNKEAPKSSDFRVEASSRGLPLPKPNLTAKTGSRVALAQAIEHA